MIPLQITIHLPELVALGEKLMATFQETMQHVTDLSDSVHMINTGLDAVRAEIQGLKDQIAAGGVVTQAELDALDAKVVDTQTEAQSVLTQEGAL